MSEDEAAQILSGLARIVDPKPGELVGEYRIESKLADGGMASVFAAVHPIVGKRAAIKVISKKLCADAHAVERFVQEARTVNQIGHPNVTDIFAFGTLPDGRCYFVMEWLQGETLRARMARGHVPIADTVDVLVQLVHALEAAHQKGVVHRDVKPDNVFIVEAHGRLQAKLLDFGIAKLSESDATVGPRTRSGVAVGTAGYMSPEQARNKRVDHRTDIYALGCLAYELLLGQLPFVADTSVDMLAMHLASAPRAPRDLWAEIPRPLEQLLLRMLDKDPEGRPTLGEVKSVLLSVRSVPPPRPSQLMPAAPRGEARKLLPFAAVAVGALALGAALTYRMIDRRPAPVAITPPPAAAPAATPPPPADAPAAASLVLHVSPPGARVLVDDRPVVVENGVARVQPLAPGRHTVTARASGHKSEMREVVVAPGATVEMPIVMTPRGASQTKAPATKQPPSRDYMLDPFAD